MSLPTLLSPSYQPHTLSASSSSDFDSEPSIASSSLGSSASYLLTTTLYPHIRSTSSPVPSSLDRHTFSSGVQTQPAPHSSTNDASLRRPPSTRSPTLPPSVIGDDIVNDEVSYDEYDHRISLNLNTDVYASVDITGMLNNVRNETAVDNENGHRHDEQNDHDHDYENNESAHSRHTTDSPRPSTESGTSSTPRNDVNMSGLHQRLPEQRPQSPPDASSATFLRHDTPPSTASGNRSTGAKGGRFAQKFSRIRELMSSNVCTRKVFIRMRRSSYSQQDADYSCCCCRCCSCLGPMTSRFCRRSFPTSRAL